MSVSIIISTHNRPKLLRLTLTSILRQRVLPDEVLIVDDASTTSISPLIMDIIDKMRCEGVEVRVFRFDKEVGLGAARLFGAYKSRCKYLVFIDDDVLVDNSLVEAYVNRFKKGDCDIIAGVCLPLYVGDMKPPSWWDERVLGGLVAVRNDLVAVSKKTKPQDYVYGCNFAVCRDVLKIVKGFKPWLGRVRGFLLSGEESDLVARACYKGLKVCFEEKAIVHHIITPSKVTLRRVVSMGVSTAIVRALFLYEGVIQKPFIPYLVGCCLVLPKDFIELLFYLLRRRPQYSVKKLHEFLVHLLIPFYYKRCIRLRRMI